METRRDRKLPYIALVKCPRPAPKGRPLDLEEVVQLFRSAKDHHLKVFMAFMLGTSARTSAILELLLCQIDLKAGLIELNPNGRLQTKKYRPVVKLPTQLREYVEEMGKRDLDKNVVCYRGMSPRLFGAVSVLQERGQGYQATYKLILFVIR